MSTSTEPVLIRAEGLDPLWSKADRKPTMRAGKMYINPFGVIMGKNLSGQTRGENVVTDKAFMRTTERFGIINPVIVRQIDTDGVTAYLVVAGNRRTFALRHLVGTGVIDATDSRALLPVYEMNNIELAGVSPEDAANLLENGMRQGMDHIAKARAIDALIVGGASKEELALLVTGPNRKPLSGEAIRQYRKLLKLHPSVQEAVVSNILKVMTASQIADDTHEEQLKYLQRVIDAQVGSKNKHQAAQDAIKKAKKEKRTDEEGEPIFDAPRTAIDIRRAVKKMSKGENWDCIPKTSKLSNDGYKAVAEIFADFSAWLEGGLTPKRYQPEEIALALQTRILATLHRIAPRTAN